jgi:hypothetical protein
MHDFSKSVSQIIKLVSLVNIVSNDKIFILEHKVIYVVYEENILNLTPVELHVVLFLSFSMLFWFNQTILFRGSVFCRLGMSCNSVLLFDEFQKRQTLMVCTVKTFDKSHNMLLTHIYN